MVGYPHIDKIVYDVFLKVMGQVEGGSLVVQKGREGKRRGSESRNQKRDLNICEGLDEALKLAKVNPQYSYHTDNRQMSLNQYELPPKNILTLISPFMCRISIYPFNLQSIMFLHQVHLPHPSQIVHLHPPQYLLRISRSHISSILSTLCILWNSAQSRKDSRSNGYDGRMTRRRLLRQWEIGWKMD